MENFTELGLKLGFIVPLVFIGVLVLLALLSWALHRKDPYGDWDMSVMICALLAGLVGVILACTSIPFDSKYLHLYRVSGEVTSVSNVLSESGGDLTRTPVLSVEGINRDITVDDPRAVNLEGKTVDFTCYVNWNYQAADSYDCKIYEIKE